jgi:hypothetical protein
LHRQLIAHRKIMCRRSAGIASGVALIHLG